MSIEGLIDIESINIFSDGRLLNDLFKSELPGDGLISTVQWHRNNKVKRIKDKKQNRKLKKDYFEFDVKDKPQPIYSISNDKFIGVWLKSSLDWFIKG